MITVEQTAPTRNARTHTATEGARYANTRILYPWKKREAGKKALCHIAAFLEINFGGQPATKTMRELGVTAGTIEDMIWAWCPEIYKDYEEVTGKELDPKLFMSRIGNMFRDNARPSVWCIGTEHPTRHPELKELYASILQDWVDLANFITSERASYIRIT